MIHDKSKILSISPLSQLTWNKKSFKITLKAKINYLYNLIYYLFKTYLQDTAWNLIISIHLSSALLTHSEVMGGAA